MRKPTRAELLAQTGQRWGIRTKADQERHAVLLQAQMLRDLARQQLLQAERVLEAAREAVDKKTKPPKVQRIDPDEELRLRVAAAGFMIDTKRRAEELFEPWPLVAAEPDQAPRTLLRHRAAAAVNWLRGRGYHP